ncbi:MAG TPA: family 1 encapsulin nanocompartment shell protein [Acidimicrobiales bacterium]|nr:family 1 encapsulin nanocompartment shell protein [Acidimicrobiales bacterium]
MNHLLRQLAPIPDAGWDAIEQEVRPRLETHLAARKLVDFEGPLGWTHSATTLGRTTTIAGPAPEVTGSQRRVLPLVELRADFVVRRSEIDDAERGATDLELAGLEEAGRRLALAENTAVFHGYAPGQIRGITESTSHAPLTLSPDAEHYPTAVAEAVDVLRRAGIGGPYGLALSPGIYTEIVHTAEHGGHLLLDHLRQILGGPLVWAPGVEGGIVLSLRGGDFVFECGQDISIGYASHDAETVSLYLEESFSFRVLEPDAAVALRSKPKKG